MSVFGGLEDNAPDGNLDSSSVWHRNEESLGTFNANSNSAGTAGADADATGALSAPASAFDPHMYESAHAEGSSDGDFNISATTGIGTASKVAASSATAATSAARRRKRLTITVTGIEIPRADEMLVCFNVQAQLPRFQPTYRSVCRTHAELRRFADHLSCANPECFVPALPTPSTSHSDMSEKCSALQRRMQKWFDRVTRSPLLTRDDEFLYFVEATTGYVPVMKIKPPATGLARKFQKQFVPPPDENEELREFRPQAKLLYQFSGEMRIKLERLTRLRRQQAAGLQRLSGSIAALAPEPADVGSAVTAPLFSRLSHVENLAAVAELRRAETQEVTIGDTVADVAREAFIIKETLTNRHILIRDLIKSQQATKEKHLRATRLKGQDNISSSKVDSAITELEAAAHLEKRITTTVHRVSDNLVAEKQLALSRIEADVLDAVAAYALRSIDTERACLAGWEDGRGDVRAADPHGGLSALGRSNNITPSHRKRFSQSMSGDEWSDRPLRARDVVSTPESTRPEPEVLGERQAAQLLAAD